MRLTAESDECSLERVQRSVEPYEFPDEQTPDEPEARSIESIKHASMKSDEKGKFRSTHCTENKDSA